MPSLTEEIIDSVPTAVVITTAVESHKKWLLSTPGANFTSAPPYNHLIIQNTKSFPIHIQSLELCLVTTSIKSSSQNVAYRANMGVGITEVLGGTSLPVVDTDTYTEDISIKASNGATKTVQTSIVSIGSGILPVQQYLSTGILASGVIPATGVVFTPFKWADNLTIPAGAFLQIQHEDSFIDPIGDVYIYATVLLTGKVS